MAKKLNILSRALAKLRSIEKQLEEESEVLGELKAKETADEQELDVLRAGFKEKDAAISRLNEELQRAGHEKDKSEAELLRALNEKDSARLSELEAAAAAAEKKEAEAASLKAELGKLQDQNADLLRALAEKDAEFRGTLERERAEFRLNCVKLEKVSADAEKEFLGELDALKAELRERAAELVKAGADRQLTLDRTEAVKREYEGQLLLLQETNAALSDALKKQKAEGDALLQETRGRLAEIAGALAAEQSDSRAARDKAHAEARELAEANRRLRGENEALAAEAEKLSRVADDVRAERAAIAGKFNEQDIFAKSAVSALKEKEEDLRLMGEKIKDLSEELAKSGESYYRRAETQRMELEEKKGFAAHLGRELEKARAEAERLKAKLAEFEDPGGQPGAGRDEHR